MLAYRLRGLTLVTLRAEPVHRGYHSILSAMCGSHKHVLSTMKHICRRCQCLPPSHRFRNMSHAPDDATVCEIHACVDVVPVHATFPCCSHWPLCYTIIGCCPMLRAHPAIHRCLADLCACAAISPPRPPSPFAHWGDTWWTWSTEACCTHRGLLGAKWCHMAAF